MNTTNSAFAYNPAAEVTGFNYGNGVSATFGYDSSCFLVQNLAYASTRSNLFKLSSYGYTQNGGNNGQITSITRWSNWVGAPTATDALNPHSTAVTAGSAAIRRGLSWTYDRYGNRTAQTVTAGTAPPSSLLFDVTKDRVTQPVTSTTRTAI